MARRADELGERRALAVLAAALGVIVGLIAGSLGVALLGDALLWSTFLTSAGFGGAAAVAAALIAFAAALYTTRSARQQAEADRRATELRERKDQWWSRAEWALSQVARGGSPAVIGLGVLEALGRSEWADQHEADIIAAATEFALTADAAAPDETDGADLDQPEGHARDSRSGALSTPDGASGTMDGGGDGG